MEKKLELQFVNEEGRIVTLSLDAPVDPVDASAVNAAMDTVLLQNAFYSTGGELVAKKAARIVTRTVEMIELP